MSGFHLWHGGELEGYEALVGYDDMQEEFEVANRVMVELGQQIAAVSIAEYQLPSKKAELCDVGGGEGQLVAEFARHWPKTSVTVFDLPKVENMSLAYLETILPPDRYRYVAGDFFQPYPSALETCDVFFLRSILHDWPDDKAVAILRNLKEVAKPGAKVAVIEAILNPQDCLQANLAKHFLDIQMIAVMPPGARERSLPEYTRLFNLADISAEPRHISTRSLHSILELSL